MKFISLIVYLLFSLPLFAQDKTILLSEDLILVQLSENVYLQKSYADSETYGRFSSNGLIYLQNQDAIIIDTPADSSEADLLIKWLTAQDIINLKLVVNHHHYDTLGSINKFHANEIPSYGYIETSNLAKETGYEKLSYTFKDSLEIRVHDLRVVSYFPGEGHTVDNTVTWLPDLQILFGGCMIKSLGSGRGNLEDANLEAWPNTVQKVKAQFPNVAIIIPGHGKHGGIELLDFTIDLFKN